MQKSVKVLTEEKNCSNYEYWIIIMLLILKLLGIIFIIIEGHIEWQFLENTNTQIQLKY